MYFSGINPFKMMVKDFDLFWKFYPAAMTRAMFVKVTGKKLRSKIYGGNKVVHRQDKGNNLLKKYMYDGQPFMFGRHGSNASFAFIRLLETEGLIAEVPFATPSTAKDGA